MAEKKQEYTQEDAINDAKTVKRWISKDATVSGLQIENTRLKEINGKLLEALKDCLHEYNHWTSLYTGEAVERVRRNAREAIALAESEK